MDQEAIREEIKRKRGLIDIYTKAEDLDKVAQLSADIESLLEQAKKL